MSAGIPGEKEKPEGPRKARSESGRTRRSASYPEAYNNSNNNNTNKQVTTAKREIMCSGLQGIHA